VHDRVIGGEAFAQEGDRTDVGNRRRGNAGRHEAGAGVPEHQQLIAAERDRPEKPGIGIADGLDRTARKLVAKDVGDTRQLGAAVEITAVS
jgi:hypothetical protein